MAAADGLDDALVRNRPEPWERLPGETTHAEQLFRAYRDRGPQRQVTYVDGRPAPAYWRPRGSSCDFGHAAAVSFDVVDAHG